MEDRGYLIDIEKVLQDKLPKYYRYIPKFVISYLRKIIHQEELNEFLMESKGKEGMDFLEASMGFMNIKLNVRGEENIPQDDKLYTFVSNHPLGGQDGVALGYILGQKYNGNIKYLVNDILMNIKGLSPLFIPVNTVGSQSKQLAEQIREGFASKNQLIMFPAGLCSRRIKGKVQDLEWKKTFVVKSIESQRDVVPIHFEGQNSNFFYNLANFCGSLGIKVNIAMLYLVDEMFKSRNKTFTVTFGKPIPWQTFTNDKTPMQWAQEVRKEVYKLKNSHQE